MSSLESVISHFKNIAVAIRSATGYQSGIKPIEMASMLLSVATDRGFGDSYGETIAKLIGYTNLSDSAVYGYNNEIIKSSAFLYHNNLTDVRFPKCKIVRYNAFCRCSALHTVYFPAVTLFESSVFYYCSRLLSVYFLGSSVPTFSSNMFTYTPLTNSTYLSGKFGSIYVRASMLSIWNTATTWTYYSSKFIGITSDPFTGLVFN